MANGFRYCQWCNGRGCVGCDGERKKWEAKSKDDVKLAEFGRAFNGLDSFSFDQVDAAYAEMEKPEPGFGEPIFTIRRDHLDADMEAAKTFLHYDKLKETFADGVTPEAMAKLTEQARDARVIQAIYDAGKTK